MSSEQKHPALYLRPKDRSAGSS